MVSTADIKGVFQLVKKGATIEAQGQIVELEALVYELKSENLELKEQIRELKSQLNVSKNMQYEAPYYWHEKGEGEKDGPFCQKCFDDTGKQIRLQNIEQGNWHCKVCNTAFQDSSYSPQQYRPPKSIRSRGF